MPLRLNTAPTAAPVSLDEAKAHLRVTHTSDDTEITAMLASAVSQLDGKDGDLGRALCTQTWDLLLDRFPEGWGEIVVPLPPLQSVTSITYVDTDGNTQTLGTDVYATDIASEPGVISLKYGQTWPATRCQRNAVTVQFVAGYGDETAVPEALKSAIKLMVCDLYENREAQGEMLEPNAAVENILFRFRV